MITRLTGGATGLGVVAVMHGMERLIRDSELGGWKVTSRVVGT